MKSPESFPGRTIAVNQILLPSTTQAVDGTGEAFALEGFSALCLQLDVTAAAETSADLLDVYLQTTIDGSNWVDIYHFTQIAGDDDPQLFVGKLAFDAALTEFENGTALDPADGRAIFGDRYRVRWTVVDDSESASFTFSVVASGT